jgi:hypothetical protein
MQKREKREWERFTDLRETEWLSTGCDAGLCCFPLAGCTILALVVCTSWGTLGFIVAFLLFTSPSSPSFGCLKNCGSLKQRATKTRSRQSDLKTDTAYPTHGSKRTRALNIYQNIKQESRSNPRKELRPKQNKNKNKNSTPKPTVSCSCILTYWEAKYAKPTNNNNNNNNTGDCSLTRGLRNYVLEKPDLTTTAYIHRRGTLQSIWK